MDRNADGMWAVGPGLVESAWRYRWLLAASLVVGLLLGYVIGNQQQTIYQTEARILLTDPASAGIFEATGGAGDVDPERYVRNQAEQIESEPVLERALELLQQSELPSGAEITSSVVADQTDSVVIRVRHPSAAGAVATAEAVIEAYDALAAEAVADRAQQVVEQLTPVALDLELQISALQLQLVEAPDNPLIESQLRSTSDRVTEVRRQIQAVEIDAGLFGSGIQRLEDAAVPSSPVQPQPLRSAVLVAFAAIAAAAGYAWWANSRREDIESLASELLGAPVIGRVQEFGPDIRAKVLHHRRADRQLEKAWAGSVPGPYHVIASSLTLGLREVKGNIVAVTSMTPGEGKTLTSLNLAAAVASSGRSVLLLDTDVHRSGLREVAPEIDLGPTMADLAERPEAIDDITVLDRPGSGQVAVMRVGDMPADGGTTMFRSEAFRAATRELGDRFDLVVIDCAPVVPVVDAIDVSECADGILIVVTPLTSRIVLVDGQQRLAHSDAPILGIVVNRSDAPAAASVYGYGYGYGAPEPARELPTPFPSLDAWTGPQGGASPPATGPHPRDAAV